MNPGPATTDMVPGERERVALQRAREHLDGWIFEGRDRAYEELFEGPGAEASNEERRILDRIDSDLTRRAGNGIWGADEYTIVPSEVHAGEGPRVVCTVHPEIPGEGYRGEESLAESTRSELIDLLWDYCERVAELVQVEVDNFLSNIDEPTA